jgi:PAS domain S-box-containing protein
VQPTPGVTGQSGEALDRLTRLQALTASLSEAVTSGQVAEAILSQAAAVLGANRGHVARLSDDGTEFLCLHATGYSEEVATALSRFPADARTPLAEAVRDRQPVLLADLAERDARYPDLAHLTGLRAEGALAALPLVVRSKAIGGIVLRFPTVRPFPEQDRTFLLAVAGLCAQALDRARLYDAERAARERAEHAEEAVRQSALCGIATDITEPKRAAEALRVSEERFARFMQHLPGLAWTKDERGRYLYANDAAAAAFGRPAAELYGRTDEEIFPPETAAQFRENDRQALASGSGVRMVETLEHPDGSRHYSLVSKFPIPGPDGSASLVGGMAIDITEEMRTRAVLEESEGRFRGLMEQAPFGIQVLGPDGHILRVNRAWEELWGVTLDQAADYNVLYDPQLENKGVAPYLRRAFAGEPVEIPAIPYDPNETIPNRTRHQDALRWVSAVAYPLKDDNGRVREVILIDQDITDRKRAEDKLRDSEEQFRQLADAMPQIVWTARQDGTIDYLNRRWTEFTGLPQTVSNDAWEEILHPDDRKTSGERWAASVEHGVPFEMEIRLLDRRERTYRWHLIRTVAVKDESGKVVRWYGTSTDIHEQKRAAETSRYLAEASAALAGVVEYESTLQKVASLAVPCFADWSALDLAGEDGSLRRLAVAHQDPAKVALVGDLMREYPPDPSSPLGVLAVLRTGKPEILGDIPDALLVQRAKDERHLRLIRSLGLKSSICVPLIVSGKALGVLTFATAESDRRYSDADLAVAMDLAHRAAVAVENARLYEALKDADRRKDEFLATLAHELRNPLAPIRNSLLILKMSALDEATVQETTQMMERQVHQLVRLVDDLLDVSRVMRGKIDLRREPVELAEVVARAVETARPAIDVQGHALDIDVPDASLLLDADPVRLAQVVSNLLTNSAKYTESHGRIWVKARREGDRMVLSVRDTGIGIAPDLLPHVFDLFVQADHASARSQGGLGIGLTLVRSLVEMHEGSVEARSEGLGRGAEFVVRLPLVANPDLKLNDDRKDVLQEDRSRVPCHRLLVVDDNRDAALTLAMLLRLQGHVVEVAHDGPSALELATSIRPALVFLDIGMPGMDGYEVAHRLRKSPGLEKTVLVALTGWGQEEDRRRTAEAGFDHHLVKPAELRTVAGLLASLLL